MSKVNTQISNNFCPQTLFLYGTYKGDGTPNFGLFCWFSYFWDTELGVMACIGGEKLTKDRIHATNIFSANLVTENILPLADYFGNVEGYNANKMSIDVEVTKGAVLHVPVLATSPWSYELEVFKSIPLNNGEIFLCKIRNILADERLLDNRESTEQKVNEIAPVCTTCKTYFSWNGRKLGGWGELQNLTNSTK
jgi:flavin reductase (DIM6/NTAB) family NADH-FMN oxidoreductase RutF